MRGSSPCRLRVSLTRLAFARASDITQSCDVFCHGVRDSSFGLPDADSFDDCCDWTGPWFVRGRSEGTGRSSRMFALRTGRYVAWAPNDGAQRSFLWQSVESWVSRSYMSERRLELAAGTRES